MSIKRVVPLVFTSRIDEARNFYVGKLGFKVTFEGGGYLGLRWGDSESSPEIGFMRPEGEQARPFAGEGLSFCFEVEDVDSEYERLTGEGVAMLQEPTDNPWGDRSIICKDPSGVSVYIYQPIEPAEEYRDAFK